MRFRPWPKPEPYRDTSRKRAAFKRKQRLESEALPLFADMIAAGQHGVDEEMACRTSGGASVNASSVLCAPHGGAKPVRACSRYRAIFASTSENSGVLPVRAAACGRHPPRCCRRRDLDHPRRRNHVRAERMEDRAMSGRPILQLYTTMDEFESLHKRQDRTRSTSKTVTVDGQGTHPHPHGPCPHAGGAAQGRSG